VFAHRSRSRRSSSSSARSPLFRAALLDAVMVAPSVSRSALRCTSRSACTVAIAAHISTCTRALPAAHQHHTQRGTAASQRDLTPEQVQNSCSIRVRTSPSLFSLQLRPASDCSIAGKHCSSAHPQAPLPCIQPVPTSCAGVQCKRHFTTTSRFSRAAA
jgi:hypothetical protein